MIGKNITVAYKEYETIYPDQVCHTKGVNIFTVDYCYIQAYIKCGGIVYDVLTMESDNHADTHFFGANLLPIMYTRKIITVAPFLPEYSEQTDVPIFTGETYFDTKNVITYLLVFGQGIWFGNLTKSL